MSGEVLVAFGTRHESTRGIAAAVAEILRAAGIPVILESIDTVGTLSRVRGAVLGSAVYPDLDVRLRTGGPGAARHAG
jgi:menaquinone-dependent protoporphyrinogen IX oxidase